MKRLLCASTASLALVLASVIPMAAAFAADLSIAPIYRAPQVPIASWTGSYVGVSGGGAWGNAVVRNDVTGADQTPRFNQSGGIVGITAGFNIQNGSLLLGYEGDISATNKKGSAFDFPPNAAFNTEVKERWLSTFRGRVGYAQGNWLLYATGGAALANIETNIFPPAAGQISEQQWHWGWTAGGGVEVKLNQDWSAKLEYLYVGLQNKSYFNPAPTLALPSNQRVSPNDQIVRVGVNYKLPWNVLDSFFKR